MRRLNAGKRAAFILIGMRNGRLKGKEFCDRIQKNEGWKVQES